MGAPISRAPGIFCVLKEKLHAHNIPRFKEEVFGFCFLGGGGTANFIFMGAGIL